MAQSDPDLYIKAQSIMRFARYITWPDGVIGKNFIIGVVGDQNTVDELKRNLERFRPQDRPLEIRQIKDISEIGVYPIIYYTNKTSVVISGVINKTINKPVLLISERPGLAKNRGTDINFVKPVDDWLYEIVAEQISNKGLFIPEQILQSAWKIIPLVEKETEVVYKTTEPKIITEYVKDPKAEREIKDLQTQIAAKDEEIQRVYSTNPEQAKKLKAQVDSLTERYDKAQLAFKQIETEEKLRKEKQKVQEEARKRTEQQREIEAERQQTYIGILIAIVLLLLMLAILFYNFSQRRKKVIRQLQQARTDLSLKAQQLDAQNNKLEEAAKQMDQQNKEINIKNEQLTEKTVELEDQNRKITDSIRYANTIQQALLPGEKRFRQLFDDHFVIYEPKDIVSGDFYWINTVEDKTLIAVVDCTGHGVPGAFMSTVGTDLLNEIVNENEFSPARILDALHVRIYERLRQGDTNNRDGMDLCLCLIRKANQGQYLVTFSGAKRPLYYTQNQTLKRLNGDSKYIGGVLKPNQAFNNYDLILQKNDVLYLSTDGFADAPNPERRKFGSMRFQEMLNAHWQKPLDIQREIFLSELNEHRQETPSRDDITLVGVRL
ncbi:MAG: hypothetical protein OHK0053_05490 [Microscillaceae bacterium]